MDYSFEPNVVVIGGGTGLSVLLAGLKRFTTHITAVVTVADDGGSSGKLREDLGMLPPGDIRSCILALSNTEPSMEKLLNYRFDKGTLEGQSFGNLFLAAMNEIYGSFDKAIQETCNVLAVTGRVYPVTLEDVTLTAELEDGSLVIGESHIPEVAYQENSRIVKMAMEPNTICTSDYVLRAIEHADLVVLGPGSLYTSVIPNLLVNGIVEGLRATNAPKVYVSNVMTQRGETTGYKARDHIEAILLHSSDDLLDYVIANVGEIDQDILANYQRDLSTQVVWTDEDTTYCKKHNIEPLLGNFVEVRNGYIRHNNIFVSQKLHTLADEYKKKKND